MNVAKLAEGDVAASAKNKTAEVTGEEFADGEIPDIVEGKVPEWNEEQKAKAAAIEQHLGQFVEGLSRMEAGVITRCFSCRKETTDQCGRCNDCFFCSKDCIRKVFSICFNSSLIVRAGGLIDLPANHLTSPSATATTPSHSGSGPGRKANCIRTLSRN
jgi:hypothetical protein